MDLEFNRVFKICKTNAPLHNAVSYLTPLDNFIKRELRFKKYVCYVDDFVILDLSLSEAKGLKVKVEKFLQDELGLELSKAHIAKIKKALILQDIESGKLINL